MTDKELRSKYPDVWDNVESSMIEWLTSTANMPGLYIDLYKDDPENSKLGIIAHNAAFAACVELHKYLKTNQKTGGMIMYYRECEENKATHTAAPLGNLDKEIYLEELPQPEQEWVSVDDRLPDHANWIWIACEYDGELKVQEAYYVGGKIVSWCVKKIKYWKEKESQPNPPEQDVKTE